MSAAKSYVLVVDGQWHTALDFELDHTTEQIKNLIRNTITENPGEDAMTWEEVTDEDAMTPGITLFFELRIFDPIQPSLLELFADILYRDEGFNDNHRLLHFTSDEIFPTE